MMRTPGRLGWGRATDLPRFRARIYQWHEHQGADCCDPFGPFCAASIAYASQPDTPTDASIRHAHH